MLACKSSFAFGTTCEFMASFQRISAACLLNHWKMEIDWLLMQIIAGSLWETTYYETLQL